MVQKQKPTKKKKPPPKPKNQNQNKKTITNVDAALPISQVLFWAPCFNSFCQQCYEVGTLSILHMGKPRQNEVK